MNLNLTFNELLNGNHEIVEYYQSANQLWSEFWEEEKNLTSLDLPNLVTKYQTSFESKCGGTSIAKEIMGWSGYAYLLNSKENFDIAKIAKLDNAFSNSTVSLEIKMYSDKAVEFFELQEELNEYLKEIN